jgi:hypothetical protein
MLERRRLQDTKIFLCGIADVSPLRELSGPGGAKWEL